MKNYEKPIVLANADIFEGVYTASGFTGGILYSVQEIPEASSGTYKTYSVSFINQGKERIENFAVSAKTIGGINNIEVMGGITCTLGSGIVTISYNGGIDGNARLDDVGTITVHSDGTSQIFGLE